MKRSLLSVIEELSKDKFILLTGPRQIGKTTLAKEWLIGSKSTYLNYDEDVDRFTILKKTFLDTSISKVVFDEIHKYPRWKNFIKGIYDKHSDSLSAIITGSARLDTYQRGSDSMFGRFELLHLHPLSIGELQHGIIPEPPSDWLQLAKNNESSHAIWRRLSARSGFPEPYIKNDAAQHQRWSIRRRTLLLRQDVLDLSQVKLIDLIEHLYLLLPERVGAPLSINSLREILQISHETASTWIQILERLFIVYRLKPYTKKISRALHKETKLYLWDWSQIENPGARFENMCASHLLKAVNYWTQIGLGEFDLQYIRDKQKNEIDFIITKSRKPIVLIECKISAETISESLIHLGKIFPGIPKIQLVEKDEIDQTKGDLRIVTASKFLTALP